jgi:hypothetical protein
VVSLCLPVGKAHAATEGGGAQVQAVEEPLKRRETPIGLGPSKGGVAERVLQGACGVAGHLARHRTDDTGRWMHERGPRQHPHQPRQRQTFAHKQCIQ